jgi:hypothetical protein
VRSDAPRDADRPIGELLRDLGVEVAALVRAEIELAQVEIVAKTKPVAASAGMFGGTALFALGAFGAATAFVIAGIAALGVAVWASALIVTVVYGIAALVMLGIGKRRLRAAGRLFPEQTAQTVKEDIEWAKTRVRSGAR